MAKDVDLLSTVFGLPTRWDIERTDWKASQKIVSPRRYDSQSDETSDSGLSIASDESRVHKVGKSGGILRSRAFALFSKPANRKASIFYESRKNQKSLVKSSHSRQTRVGESTSTAKTSGRNKRIAAEPCSPSTFSSSICLHTSTTSQSECDPQDQSSSGEVAMNRTRELAPTPNLQTQAFPVIYTQPAFPLCVPQYTGSYSVQRPAQYQPQQRSSSPGLQTDFRELHRVQQEMNHTKAKLSTAPDDSTLQAKIQNLQIELNGILDSMMTGRGISGEAKTSQSPDNANPSSAWKTSSVSKVYKRKSRTVKHKKSRQILVRKATKSTDHRPSELARNGAASPVCTILHHLCSGCDKIRSSAFQDKHPILVGRKTVPNYCFRCREAKLKQGILDRHHFCYGCGQVRSKQFHDKYHVIKGQPLMPNYCGKCVLGIRSFEDISAASMINSAGSDATKSCDERVGSLYRQPTGSQSPVAADRPSPTSVSPENIISEEVNGSKVDDLKQPPVTAKEFISPDKNRPPKLRLKKIVHSNVTASPVSPAVSSPFCPSRPLGSAQRRAQRDPTAAIDRNSYSSSKVAADYTDYVPPYVKDSEAGGLNLRGRAATCEGGISDTRPMSISSLVKDDEHIDSNATPSKRICHQDQFPLRTPKQDQASRNINLDSAESSGNKTIKYKSPSVIPASPKSLVAGGTYSGAFSRLSSHDLYDEGDLLQRSEEHGMKHPPGQKTRRKSPLADFSNASHAVPHVYEDGLTDEQDSGGLPEDYCEPPFFRSSKGAFATRSPVGDLESGFRTFKHDTREFERPIKSFPGSQSNFASTSTDHGEYHRQEKTVRSSGTSQAESSFTSTSTSAYGPAYNPATKRQDVHEEPYSRPTFTEHSHSTSNPYYKPRRNAFSSCFTGGYNCSGGWKSWTWSNRENKEPRSSHQQYSTDTMPDPIVEEPSSPPQSPKPRTMLLEFNIYEDVSVSSSSLEESIPSTTGETPSDACSAHPLRI